MVEVPEEPSPGLEGESLSQETLDVLASLPQPPVDDECERRTD